MRRVFLFSSPPLLVSSVLSLSGSPSGNFSVSRPSFPSSSVANWVRLLFSMSGLKNSPFGKRLRASHREPALTTPAVTDDDLPSSSTTPPFNPIFGISTPSLTLDSSSTFSENRDNGGSESPTKDFRGSHKGQRFLGGGISMGAMGIVREYGDRFVPSKDSGDLRTSYHLMEEGGGGPSTPSKSRIIPSESDALKGEYPLLFIYTFKLTNL